MRTRWCWVGLLLAGCGRTFATPPTPTVKVAAPRVALVAVDDGGFDGGVPVVDGVLSLRVDADAGGPIGAIDFWTPALPHQTQSAATAGFDTWDVDTRQIFPGEGVLTVYVTPYDASGNAAAPAEYSFRVDNAPPTVTIASPAPGTLLAPGAQQFVVCATDSTPPIALSINGQAAQVVTDVDAGCSGETFAATVAIDVGNLPVNVVASDAVQPTANTSSTTFGYTVEFSPVTLEVTSPANGAVLPMGRIPLVVCATGLADAGSGLIGGFPTGTIGFGLEPDGNACGGTDPQLGVEYAGTFDAFSDTANELAVEVQVELEIEPFTSTTVSLTATRAAFEGPGFQAARGGLDGQPGWEPVTRVGRDLAFVAQSPFGPELDVVGPDLLDTRAPVVVDPSAAVAGFSDGDGGVATLFEMAWGDGGWQLSPFDTPDFSVGVPCLPPLSAGAVEAVSGRDRVCFVSGASTTAGQCAAVCVTPDTLNSSPLAPTFEVPGPLLPVADAVATPDGLAFLFDDDSNTTNVLSSRWTDGGEATAVTLGSGGDAGRDCRSSPYGEVCVSPNFDTLHGVAVLRGEQAEVYAAPDAGSGVPIAPLNVGPTGMLWAFPELSGSEGYARVVEADASGAILRSPACIADDWSPTIFAEYDDRGRLYVAMGSAQAGSAHVAAFAQLGGVDQQLWIWSGALDLGQAVPGALQVNRSLDDAPVYVLGADRTLGFTRFVPDDANLLFACPDF